MMTSPYDPAVFDRPDRDRYATSFAAVAGAYERGRPDYPVAAIRWLLGSAPIEVLDLAAGTGKLTRQLVAEGHRVVAAVEPLPELREEFERAVPGVPVLEGFAEGIPLPDGCVDAVAVAQAFHWFDFSRALPEIARVLRPGGTLALVWNHSDRSVGWVEDIRVLCRPRRKGNALRRTRNALRKRVRALAPVRWLWLRIRALVRGADKPAPRASVAEKTPARSRWQGPLEASPPFAGYESKIFSHEQPLDLDGLLHRVSSKGVVAARKPKDRERVLSRIERLWEEHPELASRQEVMYPYRTIAVRSIRRSTDPVPQRDGYERRAIDHPHLP